AVLLSVLRGGGDVAGVLDGAGGEECGPVVFLQRPAYPGRRYDESLGARVNQRARELRKAQVVAGHEPQLQSGDLYDDRRDIARRQLIRLLVAERVVQMDLPVRPQQRTIRANSQQCVVRPSLVTTAL